MRGKPQGRQFFWRRPRDMKGSIDLATSHADQAEKDHASLLKAIKRGEIPVETGI